MPIDLWFYTKADDPVALAIQTATGGPEFHVEAFLPETGEFFSAHWKDGVHLVKGLPTPVEMWYRLQTPWELTPEAYAWAKSRVGMPYDKEGVISAATRSGVRRADHYWCSDIVQQLLSRTKLPANGTPSPLGIPEMLCPVGLALAAKALLCGDGPVSMTEMVGRHYVAQRRKAAKVTVIRPAGSAVENV